MKKVICALGCLLMLSSSCLLPVNAVADSEVLSNSVELAENSGNGATITTEALAVSNNNANIMAKDININNYTFKSWISKTAGGTAVKNCYTGVHYYYCFKIVNKTTGADVTSVSGSSVTLTIGSLTETFTGTSGSIPFYSSKAGNLTKSINVALGGATTKQSDSLAINEVKNVTCLVWTTRTPDDYTTIVNPISNDEDFYVYGLLKDNSTGKVLSSSVEDYTVTLSYYSEDGTLFKTATGNNFNIPNQVVYAGFSAGTYRVVLSAEGDSIVAESGSFTFTVEDPNATATTEVTTTTTKATTTTQATTKPTITTTVAETTTAEPQKTVYGDVDDNGTVNIVDVLTLNQYLLGIAENDEVNQKNADVDNDGTVNDADAMNILKSLVNLVTLPV